MRTSEFFLGILLASTAPSLLAAPIVYPAGGQSAEQQDRDEYECYAFARRTSGFDPNEANTALAQGSSGGGDGLSVKSTLRGAVLGAAIGAIVDGKDGAKKGAAAGGVSGLLIGGARNRRADRQREELSERRADAYREGLAEYERAFAVCMEGRGYSVR